MKKNIIIIAVIIIAIIAVCLGLFLYNNSKKEKETYINEPLMSFDQFKDINVDKIENIKLIKYTEAGNQEKVIKDKKFIANLYSELSSIKIVKETNMTCEDNTTVYQFNMKDKKSINLEIECNWVVINNKRYVIK